MTVDLLARWGSHNLGDRWQPLPLARALTSAGHGFRPLLYRGHTRLRHDGLGELQIVPVGTVPSGEVVIAVTGSLSTGSEATDALRRLVEAAGSALRRLVIWGGFQDVYVLREDWRPRSWSWLADPRVEFVARSTWDLWVYRRISGSRAGIVGGDPMVCWVPLDHEPHISTAGPVAAITSRPALERHPVAWERRLRTCGQVGLFAGTTDRPLLSAHPDWQMLSHPTEFLDWLRGCRLVVGGRLHSAVLAAAAGYPTIGVPWDGRPLGHGNSKQLAVGLTGRPGWGSFYPVLRPEDELPWEAHGWDRRAALSYRSLSHATMHGLVSSLSPAAR